MNIFAETDVFAAIIGAIVGGIIGILGSVATITISAILRNSGKLTVLTNESKIVFHKVDSMGGYVETQEIKEAQDIEVQINLDVYNNSGIPKTLANFTIELRHNKVKLIFHTKEYQRTPSGIPFSDNLSPQTIFPKQSVSIKCKTFLKQEDFKNFNSNVDFFLLAEFPKNKKFRFKFLEMELTP